MKKLLPVIVVVVLLLAAGAGYYLSRSSKPGQSTTQAPKTSSTMFSSIQDALAKSLSLQCTFTDDQHHSATAYIKAGAIREDIVGDNPTQQYNNSSVIMKDKKMYIWDTVKKQGMMMELKDEMVTPTGSTGENNTAPSGQSAGDVMAMLEKYKQYCKPAVVSDSLFTPPTDVTFQDLSKMMVPTTAMPSGVPTGMSQQDVQKMMQQYKQQVPQGQ